MFLLICKLYICIQNVFGHIFYSSQLHFYLQFWQFEVQKLAYMLILAAGGMIPYLSSVGGGAAGTLTFFRNRLLTGQHLKCCLVVAFNSLTEQMQIHIGCICSAFLQNEFLSVPKNCLTGYMQIHIGCICMIFLQNALSNVFFQIACLFWWTVTLLTIVWNLHVSRYGVKIQSSRSRNIHIFLRQIVDYLMLRFCSVTLTWAHFYFS